MEAVGNDNRHILDKGKRVIMYGLSFRFEPRESSKGRPMTLSLEKTMERKETMI